MTRTTNKSEQRQSLRKEMQQMIVAHNKILVRRVKIMNWMSLLQNIHPLYRNDYAKKLFNKGIISKRDKYLITGEL